MLGNRIWYVVGFLLTIGLALIASAGVSVTNTHQWKNWMFLNKHMYFVIIGIVLCRICSRYEFKAEKWFMYIGFISIILALFFFKPIKGAHRWISFGGFTLQPSEILKPAIIMRFAQEQSYKNIGLLCLVISLLLLQPDLGSVFLLLTVILTILFIANYPIRILCVLFGLVICIATAGYYTLPYVRTRVHAFVSHDNLDKHHQAKKSLRLFANGGFWGKGPGAGVLKNQLPEAHTDFIFAVSGEELGLVGCLFILMQFIVLWIYIFYHIDNMRIVGLGCLVLYQAWWHILANLALVPIKGFTLPLVGYGGSSFLMFMCIMGFLIKEGNKSKLLK